MKAKTIQEALIARTRVVLDTNNYQGNPNEWEAWMEDFYSKQTSIVLNGISESWDSVLDTLGIEHDEIIFNSAIINIANIGNGVCIWDSIGRSHIAFYSNELIEEFVEKSPEYEFIGDKNDN